MQRLVKSWKIKLLMVFLVLGLTSLPAGATVPGDIAAGLPLDKVVANGLGAGLPLETVLAQALDAGADYCELFRAALGQEKNLCRVIKALLDKCLPDPKLKELCNLCSLMKCAVDSGNDCVQVANCVMAGGAKLDEVRACMLNIGCPGAGAYTYEPPIPLPVAGIPEGVRSSPSR
jgi:hypothetical protein